MTKKTIGLVELNSPMRVIFFYAFIIHRKGLCAARNIKGDDYPSFDFNLILMRSVCYMSWSLTLVFLVAAIMLV